MGKVKTRHTHRSIIKSINKKRRITQRGGEDAIPDNYIRRYYSIKDNAAYYKKLTDDLTAIKTERKKAVTASKNAKMFKMYDALTGKKDTTMEDITEKSQKATKVLQESFKKKSMHDLIITNCLILYNVYIDVVIPNTPEELKTRDEQVNKYVEENEELTKEYNKQIDDLSKKQLEYKGFTPDKGQNGGGDGPTDGTVVKNEEEIAKTDIETIKSEIIDIRNQIAEIKEKEIVEMKNEIAEIKKGLGEDEDPLIKEINDLKEVIKGINAKILKNEDNIDRLLNPKKLQLRAEEIMNFYKMLHRIYNKHVQLLNDFFGSKSFDEIKWVDRSDNEVVTQNQHSNTKDAKDKAKKIANDINDVNKLLAVVEAEQNAEQAAAAEAEEAEEPAEADEHNKKSEVEPTVGGGEGEGEGGLTSETDKIDTSDVQLGLTEDATPKLISKIKQSTEEFLDDFQKNLQTMSINIEYNMTQLSVVQSINYFVPFVLFLDSYLKLLENSIIEDGLIGQSSSDDYYAMQKAEGLKGMIKIKRKGTEVLNLLRDTFTATINTANSIVRPNYTRKNKRKNIYVRNLTDIQTAPNNLFNGGQLKKIYRIKNKSIKRSRRYKHHNKSKKIYKRKINKFRLQTRKLKGGISFQPGTVVGAFKHKLGQATSSIISSATKMGTRLANARETLLNVGTRASGFFDTNKSTTVLEKYSFILFFEKFIGTYNDTVFVVLTSSEFKTIEELDKKNKEDEEKEKMKAKAELDEINKTGIHTYRTIKVVNAIGSGLKKITYGLPYELYLLSKAAPKALMDIAITIGDATRWMSSMIYRNPISGSFIVLLFLIAQLGTMCPFIFGPFMPIALAAGGVATVLEKVIPILLAPIMDDPVTIAYNEAYLLLDIQRSKTGNYNKDVDETARKYTNRVNKIFSNAIHINTKLTAINNESDNRLRITSVSAVAASRLWKKEPSKNKGTMRDKALKTIFGNIGNSVSSGEEGLEKGSTGIIKNITRMIGPRTAKFNAGDMVSEAKKQAAAAAAEQAKAAAAAAKQAEAAAAAAKQAEAAAAAAEQAKAAAAAAEQAEDNHDKQAETIPPAPATQPQKDKPSGFFSYFRNGKGGRKKKLTIRKTRKIRKT